MDFSIGTIEKAGKMDVHYEGQQVGFGGQTGNLSLKLKSRTC
jgi:hypothetical protein